jgi:ABC-2 type transport system permease protein
MKSFLWSVRRELWEHRWVYLVPLLLGGTLIATGAAISGMNTSGFAAADNPMSPTLARRLSLGLDTTARMMFATTVIVAMVYCAEALQSERHDGSIVFWKSLPVGDATAVAAKVAIPLVFLPMLGLGMVLVCQIVAGATFAGTGGRFSSSLGSPGAALTEAVIGTLWIAPVYAWILLVSSTARRAVLLIAFLPLMLVSMVERLSASSSGIGLSLFQRGVGRYWPRGHLDLVGGIDGLKAAPPTLLVRSPSFWIGVLVAALLLVGVVHARRSARNL